MSPIMSACEHAINPWCACGARGGAAEADCCDLPRARAIVANLHHCVSTIKGYNVEAMRVAARNPCYRVRMQGGSVL
jgi:hypothetical protein